MSAERTGPTAIPAALGADGVQLAVQVINDNGGVDGRPIEVVELDNGGDPARAIQHLEEMRDAGAVAVLGPISGSLCAAMAPTHNQMRLPGICMSPADLPEDDDYVFGVGVELAQQHEKAFEYLSEANGRVGVVVPSTPVGELLREHAESVPDNVELFLEEISTEDTTVKPQLQKLLSEDVGALLIAHCGSVSITAAREAIDLGFQGKILLYNCFASAGSADAIKGFTNGNVETLAPKLILGIAEDDDVQFGAIEEYLESGGQLDITAAAGWDAVQLLVAALREASETTPRGILEVLEGGLSYVGAYSMGTVTAEDHRGVTAEGALIPATFTTDGELVPVSDR